MSSVVTPWPRTKPCAAFDQFPSASKAIFFAGPFTSSSTSACFSGIAVTFTAKRRGVAKDCTVS